MKVIVCENYDEMSAKAFEVMKEVVAKDNVVLGLATGSSPVGLYQCMIKDHEENGTSYKNIRTYNLDEYVGIDRDNAQSYYTFMKENLFDHIDIDPENTNILNGNAADLQAECDRYEERIREAGGIDLFLGGVGEDGHLAFNEPFSSLNSRTRVKTLTYNTRVVNSRFFDNDVDKVPQCAMSVGVATVLDAKEVLILALGAKKARAVQHCVEGSYNHVWTISALQIHPKGIMICDEPAAEELKVSTYRYFKDIEKDNLI